jgi:hypothetical protein
MARNKDLADRVREVLISGHWIANVNFREIIESLDKEQATTRIADLNTIALLTFHLNYYLAGLINVFKGGSLDIRDKYSFDLPEVRSEDHWKALVSEFISNAGIFADWVENMDETILDQPFVDPKYGTYQRNIEGIIEHSYYHLGQASLIRKMILAN